MKFQKIQKQNVGNAGEYYIVSKLSTLDFTVSITLGRAESFDILSLRPDGKTITVSVKSSQVENVKGFLLSSKDEINPSDSFFYAFIKFNEFKTEPDYWIIPSKVVSKLISESYKKYITTTGKNGKKRSEDKGMRYLPIIVTPADEKYYPKTWQKELEKYHNNLEQLS